MDPSSGQRLKNKGTDERSTLTANGRVVLRRRRWRRVGVGAVAVVPVDSLLDAAEATVSLGTRELCCRLNGDGTSFRRTADNLKHAAGLPLSAELLRQVVEAEGKQVQRASDAGDLTPGWRASDCKVRRPDGKEVSRVYASMDGFMAPTVTDAEKRARRTQVVAARRARRRRRNREQPKPPPLPPRKRGSDRRYKEFKLVQFHDQTMARRLIAVTRKPCGEAGRLLRRDAGRIGFHEADERLGLVDAAGWIVNQFTRQCILLTLLVLDFFHLGTHVNTGKRATFGEASAEGERWARDVMHTVKHDGYAPFWDRLLHWRSAQRSKPKRAEADALLHYASAHRAMIRYDECARNGWRIGSGPTGSECSAVPDRVKGPGKRWDADNAEAVMALEAMRQSDQWNAYWASRLCGSN